MMKRVNEPPKDGRVVLSVWLNNSSLGPAIWARSHRWENNKWMAYSSHDDEWYEDNGWITDMEYLGVQFFVNDGKTTIGEI